MRLKYMYGISLHFPLKFVVNPKLLHKTKSTKIYNFKKAYRERICRVADDPRVPLYGVPYHCRSTMEKGQK